MAYLTIVFLASLIDFVQFLIDDKKFSGFPNLFHAVLIDDNLCVCVSFVA